ncbi:uncharacterized protein LOC123686450 [Harmonia axyridis]|uniref:uncharacterized protein LOC123686450 n=1 Tax=Harmonia axyridis TaxID=115357 RepID=UPI001E278BC5|nr:uncharacterized protein LOC123686450 [Harmonia axyridis]
MNKIFGVAFVVLVINGAFSFSPQYELQTIIALDRDYVPIPYRSQISGWRNNQYLQPPITTTTSEKPNTETSETTPKPKGWKRGSGTYRRDYPYGYGNKYGKGWKLRTSRYYR